MQSEGRMSRPPGRGCSQKRLKQPFARFEGIPANGIEISDGIGEFV
jgi:hypothetical protein